MNIDSIQNGIVIDHIAPGRAMRIYQMLRLSELACPVAIITGVHSNKMGKKDILKIDGEVQLNLETIGYLTTDATVNYIEDGKLVKKCHIDPPERLVNVIRCQNPHCITSTERGVDHIFLYTDAGEYRCIYCEALLKEE